MAYEQYGPFITAPAGADLSGSQYKAVKLDADGKAVLAGAGEFAVGILVDDPKLGQTATIQVANVSKAVAGAAFQAGDLLTPNATGQLVEANAATADTGTGEVTDTTADTGTGAITGDKVLAIALQDAGAAGQIVPVVIIHAGLTA
ncbi:hypothetical protein [Paenibacillus naphthalenovorans]|uniref:hypothetical protein n=1 Tax=Paenibacillus naphthalenovorans TaxID=162209 RepID=UPI003D2A3A69